MSSSIHSRSQQYQQPTVLILNTVTNRYLPPFYIITVHIYVSIIMDPISAIGLVGSVFSIADVIAKSIKSLLDLQSKYKISDLKISLLVGQLTTLKAAFGHIGDLMKDGLNFVEHKRFFDDICTSIQGCEAVIGALDSRLAALQRNDNGDLAVFSKISLLWDESTMSDYFNMLNNQISGVHFLLSILQWCV